MAEESRRTQVAGHAVDTAALRAELEELRRDRLAQLAELSQTPVGDDDLTAPRLATLRGIVAEVDAALERLDNGRYGACQRCGTSISAERLEIMPHARYCVTCQQRGE